MRISELSRTTDCPVPTIKYYLREGLLHSGELTSPNQAQYGQEHVDRLRLIRALTDLAQLSLDGVRAVVQALDAEDMSMHQRIGTAHRAVTSGRRLPPTPEGDVDDVRSTARHRVDALLADRDWVVEPDAPALLTLVDTVAALQSFGYDHILDLLDAYADAAAQIAKQEIRWTGEHAGTEEIVEAAVVGTVLGEQVLAALRLIAQEDASARRFR